VAYIFDDTLGYRPEAIDEEIKRLVANKVDMLIAIGNMPTKQAQKAVMGTNIPVVFAAVTDPVGERFVDSISHPGGNLTGIQVGASVPKALEWMVQVVPDVRKVFLPFNPEDEISVIYLDLLAPLASRMKLELVTAEVRSAEAAASAIMNLPSGIQAIFRIPSPTLDGRNGVLARAAIDRRLPMVAGHPQSEDGLLTIYSNNVDLGNHAARIAHQILQGVNPADLPVETADFFISINLKTAWAIGLNIPDLILHQADRIIR
jgi:putative ABC transport system substrate-binding protein